MFINLIIYQAVFTKYCSFKCHHHSMMSYQLECHQLFLLHSYSFVFCLSSFNVIHQFHLLLFPPPLSSEEVVNIDFPNNMYYLVFLLLLDCIWKCSVYLYFYYNCVITLLVNTLSISIHTIKNPQSCPYLSFP